MTNIWLLSKQSMKGMDLLEVATDVLFVLEQEGQAQGLAGQELREHLDRGAQLLQRLACATESQTSHVGRNDVFLLRIAEAMEKELGLPPTELVKRLEKASLELQRGSASADTIAVFEEFSDVVMRLTSRSVDAISMPLH
jgi:hypothetical protein